MRWWRRHPVSEEALSIYLDGRLEEAKARRVEAHLETCEACRGRLEELRATVGALRALPTADVPRSFALSRETVLGAQPRVMPPPVRAYRYASALSTLALAVFLALVAIDLASLGGGEPELPESQLATYSAPADVPAEAEAPAREMPTMPPPLAFSEAEEEAAPEDEAQVAAGRPAPTPEAGEAARAAEAPSVEKEGGADTGRWLLRGFEGLAAAVFLLALLVTARRWWRQRGNLAGP